MRKRKNNYDYAFSLFEFNNAQSDNELTLDTTTVSTATETVMSQKKIAPNATFMLDGREYKIIEVRNSTSLVEDLTFGGVFSVAPTMIVSNEIIRQCEMKMSSVSATINESKTSEPIEKPAKASHEKRKNKFEQTSLFDVPLETFGSESFKFEEVQKYDFNIIDADSYKSKGERMIANIQAIKLLKDLQENKRLATPQQQEILAEFTGWGGLQDIFSEKNANYHELRQLLSPKEYASAERSILDAFYTPYPVIKSIYKCLQKAGFKGGRILEPSCGTGRFFGLMPEEIKLNSRLYGIELDDITATIAAQLNQNANIRNCGFEDINYGDNVFDLAITNVPYGDSSVSDSRYNRYNFKIHDYFISKMIDVVRPGGIVVAITSSYSMDKTNDKARRYWAERADLIGSIRLPKSAFKNAHTEVITDVLLFKKREEQTECQPYWLNTEPITVDEVTTRINSVFSKHPENIIGNYKVESGPFGKRLMVEGTLDDLSVLEATQFEYTAAEVTTDGAENSEDSNKVEILPDELMSEPDYCYTLYNNKIVYKVNGLIRYYQPKNKMEGLRKRELIVLRKAISTVISAMVSEYSDDYIKNLQADLNGKYDRFEKKYGRICSRANSIAFRDDSKYPLLCSLEIYNDDGEFVRKADIFSQRTIKKRTVPKAENEQDALQISLSEKGTVDFDFMSGLLGVSVKELKKTLTTGGQLFKVPFSNNVYEPAETYLSGFVKKKLAEAKAAAATDESFKVNVQALEAVQPRDIPYQGIFCPINAPWVPDKFKQCFMEETFDVDSRVVVSKVNNYYYVSQKMYRNVRCTSTYGTPTFNALELYEDCLNLIDKRVYDKFLDANGKEKRVLNKEKTQVCREKQTLIRQKWDEWVWADRERREALVRVYNDLKNVLRQERFDGSRLSFPGMSSNIELMPHQKNAVQRIVRKGNTMLAHVVGAGKTFTMIAAAMERKRLGLSNKPLFVVPNHLVSQWAGEFARLYPFANVLVTSKTDFTTQNRKKFCAKVATGNWDAVLMSHSQFSRIPLSKERQTYELNRQLEEIAYTLSSLNEINIGDFRTKDYSKRQLESRKKALIERIKKLNDSPKDNTVTFEELGVDILFLDEAHLFKNLSVFTKLNNVAGLTNAESKKAQDLLMKTRYLNEITNYQGVVFATGTPISNAVCELYVMQTYLQDKDLFAVGINNFDQWIGSFADTENTIEVKPEGTGYRTVTRVSKYHNIPELKSLIWRVFDIVNENDITIDVPESKNHNIAVEPSEIVKQVVESFAERAEKIRSGSVDSSKDNMLCVTNDGRKIAIDQRLYDKALEDDMKSKLNRCTKTVYQIWKLYQQDKATQLVFCDMGTPKKHSKEFFDLYNDVKRKLIDWGVPESEIAFIHDANTDTKKIQLFDKVNRGEVRILLGSTEKLGAGTNVQKRLIAIHNIDCPWRPSDLQQRAGRIIRQGNMYKKAHVYTYVTKNTFDTYLYQTVLAKAKFIAQIMSNNTTERDVDDVDNACLNYAEIKALSTGNPAIKEKMELEEQVARMKVLRNNFIAQRYDLETDIYTRFPNEIKATQARIYAVETDIKVVEQHPLDEEHKFSPMVVDGTTFSVEEKEAAAEILLTKLTTEHDISIRKIAEFRGFHIMSQYNIQHGYEMVHLYSPTSGFSYKIELGDNSLGNLVRINNALASLPKQQEKLNAHLIEVERNLEFAKRELEKPFDKEAEYKEAVAKLNALNAKLAVEGSNGIENIVQED